MRSALDGTPRSTCRICGEECALVDQAIRKNKEAKGGHWVHVDLPPTVHLAQPRK